MHYKSCIIHFMKLLKLIAEIRYQKNTPEVFNFRDKIISKISSEKITKQSISEGVQVFVKNKLMKVIVGNSRLGADIIFAHSINDAQNTLVKVFKQTNTELNVIKIERIGIRTMWIHELDNTFDEIVKLFKKKLLGVNELINSACDVGLPLTLKIKDRKINFNSGPVEKIQLCQFLNVNQKDYGEININSLPEKGIYIDNDYYLMKDLKYSDNFFEEFLKEGTKDGMNRAELITKLLEV